MHLSMSSLRGEGGGVCPAIHGNLTVAYIPRVGTLIGHHAFDLSILYSRREVNHLFLLNLTIRFRPVGILIIFVRKCQYPHLCPTSTPPLGLDTDRCINNYNELLNHSDTILIKYARKFQTKLAYSRILQVTQITPQFFVI